MPGNAYVHPSDGLAGRVLSRISNSRVLARMRRRVMAALPFVRLESDVSDVVYLNWLVPLQDVAALVPKGVALIAYGTKTVLTVLTYRHGHFGPVFAGQLRKAFPSPLQSNWRLYVSRIDGVAPSRPTVLFLRNVFDNALYACGTRLFSDALPSHLAQAFEHRATGQGFVTRIESGIGSAPAVETLVSPADGQELPAEFAAVFPTWREAVTVLCLQDAAISEVPGIRRVAESGIDLPIAIESVESWRAVSFQPGALLRSLGATGTPLCFRVPKVRFKVLWERLL